MQNFRPKTSYGVNGPSGWLIFSDTPEGAETARAEFVERLRSEARHVLKTPSNFRPGTNGRFLQWRNKLSLYRRKMAWAKAIASAQIGAFQ